MYLKTFAVGPLATNCYLIADENTHEAAIIDPGGDMEAVIESIEAGSLKPVYLLLTHGHADHLLGVNELLERYDLELCIHEKDAGKLTDPEKNISAFIGYGVVVPEADRLLKNNDILKLGEMAIKVLSTPGHTKGGVSYYVESEGVVFTGDTLFCQSIGRADFPDSSFPDLSSSIRARLYSLPKETEVYPGHGPSTVIGYERENNPFVPGK